MKNTQDLPDLVLIGKHQKGDVNVLYILVNKWHIPFCRFAFWVIKDADVAKDIAQESWSVII